MKLTYRGVSYENNFSVSEPVDTNLTYRGVSYESNASTLGIANSTPVTADLKFRGTVYHLNQPSVGNAPATPVEVAEPVAAIAPAAIQGTNEKARNLMMNHHRMVKRRQQVMLTRLATSIGVAPETSSHYWNHIQGKVHPSFWATYDRSHASAS